MKCESVAGFLGMLLFSAILLGVAESIGKRPFWITVFVVMLGARDSCFQGPAKIPQAQ